MSASQAVINKSIWGLDEWLDLSPYAKLLYFTIATSPELSMCGSHPWNPTAFRERIGGEVDPIQAAADEMESKLVLVIDHSTSELLVRSWMRHDRLCKTPNIAIAAARARQRLASRHLKGVVVHEMQRIKKDNPGWRNSWNKEEVAELLAQRAIDPAGNKSVRVDETKSEGLPEGVEEQNGFSFTPLLLTKRSRSPATPSTTRYSDDFNRWWSIYPKKKAKASAAKAFTKAIKTIAVDELCKITETYATSVQDSEERFIPHGATWLNDRRFEDDEYQPTDAVAILQRMWRNGPNPALPSIAPETPFEVNWPDPFPETEELREGERLRQWREWIETNREMLLERIVTWGWRDAR